MGQRRPVSKLHLVFLLSELTCTSVKLHQSRAADPTKGKGFNAITNTAQMETATVEKKARKATLRKVRYEVEKAAAAQLGISVSQYLTNQKLASKEKKVGIVL